jgi:hypothetical protein
MEEIILCNPTLNYFVNQANWDINNPFHLELKCKALEIALMIYLERYVAKL